jgi:hypothetical protein
MLPSVELQKGAREIYSISPGGFKEILMSVKLHVRLIDF